MLFLARAERVRGVRYLCRWEQEHASILEDALEVLIASQHECMNLVGVVCEQIRVLETQ